MRRVYQQLYRHYGPQHWWPGETPFEVMVGAVLTQNTAWINVERAIANLKANDCLDAERIVATADERLATWLKPSGYFNIKARRLKNFCAWFISNGGMPALERRETSVLRRDLLSINGIGPETADDILLYAFDRPVFVIDAYTRRLFARLGHISGAEGYEALRSTFEETLGADASVFNEYHALIVAHAKHHCRKRPRCDGCILRASCAEATKTAAACLA